MSTILDCTPTSDRNVAAAKPVLGKRTCDIVTATTALLLLVPVITVIAILVKLTSKGPVLYWSDRVGLNNEIFGMPKFRTMHVGTPALATHLMAKNAEAYVTRVGKLLRRSSLDEIPQLISVLRGQMSIVGPRPALFNQYDLIALRTDAGVHMILPGVTGWAQVNGRDELPIPQKVQFDYEYLINRSILLDFRIIWLTLIKVVRRDGVSH